MQAASHHSIAMLFVPDTNPVLPSAILPEPEKLDRIGALSQVADAFRNAGVSRAGSLLKMKAFEESYTIEKHF